MSFPSTEFDKQLAEDALLVAHPPGKTISEKRRHREARLRLKAFAVRVLDALEGAMLGDDHDVR